MKTKVQAWKEYCEAYEGAFAEYEKIRDSAWQIFTEAKQLRKQTTNKSWNEFNESEGKAWEQYVKDIKERDNYLNRKKRER